MPRQSIDFLNARKELGANARKGRTVFAKATHAVDQRHAFAALDPLEQAILESDALFADFDRWVCEWQPFSEMLRGDLPSHGALLAPGESAADLEF